MGRSPRLILASGSPRRVELLRQIGITPAAVAATGIDERPLPGERPRALAMRLAAAKAAAAAPRFGGDFILAADTVVGCGLRIVGKAEKEEEARRFLVLLSGRRHRVYGGLAVRAPDGRMVLKCIATTVSFKRLTAAELDWYLDCGEWRGKAGGYAIQGRAALFVRALSGSYSNVVGLPLHETAMLLSGLGYPVYQPKGRADD